ncbi:MAG: hypothetical protein LBJ81_02185 [Puniceicoccales bacterium]|jgi:hypothetical protein|nr:hypothetical protein [Puniceicoccales bacterium]
MNKLLAITSGLLAAGSAAAEFVPPTLSVDGKVAFDTAYVSEGRRQLDQHFAPSAEVGVPLFDNAGEFYVGLDAYLKVNHKKGSDVASANKVSPYVGFSYDITDIFTLDLWYTLNRLGSKPEIRDVAGRYIASIFPDPANNGADAVSNHDGTLTPIAVGLNPFYTDLDNAYAVNMATVLQGLNLQKSPIGKRQSHEISFGIMADVLCDPALYFSYDFTQKKANVEGTIGHTFDLGSVGASGFAIDLGAKLGYTHVKKPFGIDSKTKVLQVWEDKSVNPAVLKHELGELFNKKSWVYFGANADVVYAFNEHAKARAGVAFSCNSAGKNTWVNDLNRKKHNIWFSTGLEFSF